MNGSAAEAVAAEFGANRKPAEPANIGGHSRLSVKSWHADNLGLRMNEKDLPIFQRLWSLADSTPMKHWQQERVAEVDLSHQRQKQFDFLGADEFDALFGSGHEISQPISRPSLSESKRVSVCRQVVIRTVAHNQACWSRFEFWKNWIPLGGPPLALSTQAPTVQMGIGFSPMRARIQRRATAEFGLLVRASWRHRLEIWTPVRDAAFTGYCWTLRRNLLRCYRFLDHEMSATVSR
jgi:hypothetical protein